MPQKRVSGVPNVMRFGMKSSVMKVFSSKSSAEFSADSARAIINYNNYYFQPIKKSPKTYNNMNEIKFPSNSINIGNFYKVLFFE